MSNSIQSAGPLKRFSIDGRHIHMRTEGREARIILEMIATLSAIAGLALIIARQDLLPRRFSYDADVIQRLALGHIDLDLDRSFGTVALVYRFLGLAHYETAAGIISYLPILAATALAIKHGYVVGRRQILSSAFLVAVTCTLGAVFLGTFSKEFIPAIIVLVFLTWGRSRSGRTLTIVLMLVYGLTVRTYWIAVAICFIVTSCAFKQFSRLTSSSKSRGFWLTSAVVFVCIALLSVGLFLVTGNDPGYYRTSVNDSRALDDAETMILQPLPGSGVVVGLLNNVVIAVLLLVPFPLLSLGSIYHVAVALFLVSLSLLAARAIIRTTYSIQSRAYEIDTVSLLVAFFSVQAIFEPDYGSYLRHLTPLLPLLIYLNLSMPGTGPDAPRGLARTYVESYAQMPSTR